MEEAERWARTRLQGRAEGMKDRDTDRIEVMPLDSADATTLQGFVHERTKPDTMVITDEALAYNRGASAAPV